MDGNLCIPFLFIFVCGLGSIDGAYYMKPYPTPAVVPPKPIGTPPPSTKAPPPKPDDHQSHSNDTGGGKTVTITAWTLFPPPKPHTPPEVKSGGSTGGTHRGVAWGYVFTVEVWVHVEAYTEIYWPLIPVVPATLPPKRDVYYFTQSQLYVEHTHTWVQSYYDLNDYNKKQLAWTGSAMRSVGGGMETSDGLIIFFIVMGVLAAAGLGGFYYWRRKKKLQKAADAEGGKKEEKTPKK